MRLFGGDMRFIADGIRAVAIYLRNFGVLAFNGLPFGLLNKRTAQRYLHSVSTVEKDCGFVLLRYVKTHHV